MWDNSVFAGGQLRHEEFGQQGTLVLCPEFQKQRAWPLFIVFVFSCTYLKTSPITVSCSSECSALLQIRLKVSEVSYSEMQNLSLGMTPWKAWARVTEESGAMVGQSVGQPSVSCPYPGILCFALPNFSLLRFNFQLPTAKTRTKILV